MNRDNHVDRKRGRSCVTTTGLFLHNDTLDGQRNFFSPADQQQQQQQQQQLQQQQQQLQQQQHNNAIYFRNNNNKNISSVEDAMTSSDFSKSCDHLHPPHHHPHYPYEDPLQQNGEGNFCRRQSGEVGHACDPDLYRHASLLVTLEQTPSRRRQSVSQNHQSEILLDDSLELKDGDTKYADTEGSSHGTSDEKRIEACDAIFRNNTRHRNQPTGSPFRSTAHSQLTRSFSPDAYPHQPPHYLSTHHHHHHHHLQSRNPLHHHQHQEHQELTDSNSQLLLLSSESYQQYHLDDEDDAVVIGNGSVTSQKL